MRLRHTAPVAALLLAAAAGADAPPPTPHTPLVQVAVDKHDAAVAKAAAAYAAAVAAADQQLARAADDVQKRAMRMSNLAAANDASAVKAAAEADARSKDPVLPVDQRSLLGRWTVRAAGEATADWTITPTEARHTGAAGVGRVSADGPALVVRWGTDWVDRLTPTLDQRMMKESWHVSQGNRFPQDTPSQVGVGTRD